MRKLFLISLFSLFVGCATVDFVEIKKSDYKKALGDKKSLDTAIATPVFDEDKSITGFRIQKFETNSPLLVFKLRVGDVITAVNGESLTSFLTAKRILLQAPDFAVLTVSFERDGKEQVYRYKVVD